MRVASAWLGVGLALAGCFDFSRDYAACVASGKCSDGVVPAECSGSPFPPPTACANNRDLYVSPSGDDGAPGTQDRPRKTLGGVVLSAGDRIHFLPGVYDGGLTLNGDGVSDCPITADGDPGMTSVFHTEYETPLAVRGSHWRVSNLVVEGRGYGGGTSGVYVGSAPAVSDVTLQQMQFRIVDSIQAIALFEFCTGCSLVASQVVSDGGYASSSVQVWSSPNFVFQGNVVQGQSFSGAVTFHSSPNALVALNDFELISAGAVKFENGGQFVRNVVRNANGVTAVSGADSVVSNTFTNFTNSVAADTGDFRDNIVEGADSTEANTSTGLGASDGGGAYNFFYRVKPYASGGAGATDVVGTARVTYDADFVPRADSPVIDAADPALPVPAGGGTRADIGARERGASRRADGRYCAPDAG